MRGIGQCAALALACFALVGGMSILLPEQASAQIPNIDSIIRGALQQRPGYGYRAPSHHSSSRSREDRDRDSSSSPAREKDATQDESQAANGGIRHQETAGSQNISRSQTSDAAPGGSSRGNDEQPSFAPSR